MKRAHFHYLLVRLCKVLADEAKNLYEHGDRENAEMGELLLRHGKLLTDIGWVLTQGSKEVQEKVAEIVDEGLDKRDARWLAEDLSEWLSKRIGKVVGEAEERKGEGRKELLLQLCKELTSAVEYFYHEDDAGLKAHLGEVLGRYGSLLSNIGWAITWADEEVQEKVFKVIEEAFKRKHLLKCRLEEWLSWKVREIVDEVFEDKGEERETQQAQTPTDELPF